MYTVARSADSYQFVPGNTVAKDEERRAHGIV